MGLIKPNNYDKDEMRFSLIANALSHPARNRIITIIKDERHVRNNDLAKVLNLNQQSVTRHLYYLKRAGLVDRIYHIHYDEIYLVQETLDYFNQYLNKFSKH